MVGIFDIILRALGLGWTYVLLSGIGLTTFPLSLIVMHYGPRWRENRRRSLEKLDG
jgi:hypothetical protein